MVLILILWLSWMDGFDFCVTARKIIPLISELLSFDKAAIKYFFRLLY